MTELMTGVGAGAIVIDKLCAGEVLFALSCTVTLKTKGLPAAVAGVPLMTPVAALSVNPGGNDPETTVQFWYGGTPFAAASVCE